jgi:hypothetical protein
MDPRRKNGATAAAGSRDDGVTNLPGRTNVWRQPGAANDRVGAVPGALVVCDADEVVEDDATSHPTPTVSRTGVSLRERGPAVRIECTTEYPVRRVGVALRCIRDGAWSVYRGRLLA